jgi:hypothetical protein
MRKVRSRLSTVWTAGCLSPGRAERHEFEYHRHGTLSLYAALNPQTGEVIGQTASRHTSVEFVRFSGVSTGEAARFWNAKISVPTDWTG